MDSIIIQDLEVFARHGVLQAETELGQKFLVCAVLSVDTRKPGLSDDLTDSVNYAEVCNRIKTFMEQTTFQLIEAVAEHLAEQLLLSFPLLQAVSLEIKKPWAPVHIPVAYLSVQIARSWHTAYLSIGSNLGNTERHLDDAVHALQESRHCRIVSVSDYLVTKPVGYTDQPDFLNACIRLETLLTPDELLTLLHQIEQQAHRERTIHWGPRTLDLDILFYDDLILQTDVLCIPHVEIQNRYFVLKPLTQIAPYYRHPILRQTVSQLLAILPEELK